MAAPFLWLHQRPLRWLIDDAPGVHAASQLNLPAARLTFRDRGWKRGSLCSRG